MSNNLIDVQQMKNVYNTEKQMIKLGLLNIRSLSTKELFVNDMITDHNLDVLCLTKTWLKLDEYIIAMITYNIYIVIRETGQFSSKGIINDFIGNLNRLTVSRRFTEQAV